MPAPPLLAILLSASLATLPVTSSIYTYDANGNQLTKTELANPINVTTYTYSPENWLVSSQLVGSSTVGSSSQYVYDGLDRRIQKDVNGTKTRYLYDHGDILLEYDGTNVLKARWMQGPGIDDPLLMERDLNSNGTFEPTERFVYHADGLGSITELTDNAGTVVRAYLYDAFGQLANQIGTLLNPYTYTAREYDPETGLLYYRARTYDPRTGRFLQEDPQSYTEEILANSEGSMLSQPAQGHAYIYALDNPVNLTDPDGRSPVALLLWGVVVRTAVWVGTRAAPVVRAAAPVVRGFVTRAAPMVRQAASRTWQGARAVAHSAFRRGGGWLNSNPYFRVGWGWQGSAKSGREVFRIAVGNKRAPIHGHLNLWPPPWKK